MIRRLAVLACLFTLAACAPEDQIDRLQPLGYLTSAPQRVAQADWSRPDTVTVTLSNYAFTPDHLVFHRDHPTRLILRNVGDTTHTFVSPGFFKTIAVKQVVTPAGVENGSWVESVAVPKGQTKELWFIPAEYGSWGYECTVPFHAAMGMTGVVDVAP